MKSAPRAGLLGGHSSPALVLWFLATTLAACGSVPDVPAPTAHAGSVDASAADAPTGDVQPVDASAVDASQLDTSASDGAAVDASTIDVAPASDAPGDTPQADSDTFPCGPEYSCPAGYRCVGLATVQCVRAAAVGEPCRNSTPDPVYCIPGASCEPVRGVSRCVVYGTEYGVCRNTNGCSPMCDPGLGCDPGTHCRPGLAPGELCGGAGDFCNDGSSCQDVNGTARCIADGAAGGYCRVGRLCEGGLLCQGTNSGSASGCNREYFRCVAGIVLGESCGPTGAPCVAGTTCMMSQGAMRCVARPDGTPGGRCRAVSPRCDAEAECGDGGWSCLLRVARGMSCDPTGGMTVCADGDTCSGEHVGDDGRCVAAGTAPGAECRPSEPRCEDGLQCSDFSRYRRTCRALARVGDPCDLGGIRTLCPSTTRCLPSTVSSQGLALATCVTPIAEIEPNERAVATRSAVERSVLYQASLSADDVEDCHALRMPAGSALYVETSISLVARLFRSSGVEIGRWTLRDAWGSGPLAGSARLDPAAIGVLRDLAADDYLLCLRGVGDPAALRAPLNYTLAIGVLPRSWSSRR